MSNGYHLRRGGLRQHLKQRIETVMADRARPAETPWHLKQRIETAELDAGTGDIRRDDASQTEN